VSETVRKDRNIGSIIVGFRLVQSLIDAGRALSLKELSERSDLQSGHAYLYMASFLHVGLVTQDPASSRYDLGPLAFDIGLAAMRRADVIALAQGGMHELAAHTGQSSFLAVWGNRGPTIVAKVDALQVTALQLSLGFVLSLLETATGRVFLTHLPRVQTSELLASELAAGPQMWKTRFTAASVERIVASVLDDGFATSDPSRNDGYASIAAPIFDHATIRATLTLTGPSGAFEKSAATYRTAVTCMAASISEQLGRRPHVVQ
jgi:DNA-binding IclR family transcriptional regulator